MASGIFKGPRGALIFVGVTLGSVALLVGTEDDGGALVVATDELGSDEPSLSDRNAGRLSSPPPARPSRRPSTATSDDTLFASDEELIDDASGVDPTPEYVAPFDSTQPAQDVTVVETYSREIIQ